MKRINIMLLLAAIGMVTFGTNWTVGAQEGSGTATATPGASDTAVIEITPRADGSIVHIVEPDDSFWTIAIRYAEVLDMTPEQALVHIQQLNGNPAFAVLGQELLIREAGNFVGAEGTVVAATPTIEGTAVTVTATVAAPTEEVITVDPLSTSTTPESSATPEALPLGSGCVTSFEDINGNGEFERDAESLIADAAVTLFKDGQTISTFITDGVAESHCFEELVEGSYQVQIYPPVNYVATTADSWTITVSKDMMVPVEFGLQVKEAQVAEVTDAGTSNTAAENGAATAVPTASTTETSADTESGGLLTNVGTIVVIIAIVLILLAGAGVVMLRRS